MEFVRPFFLLSLFKFSGIPCFSSRRVPCFFFFRCIIMVVAVVILSIKCYFACC